MFREFWIWYLKQHTKRLTRLIHRVGTLLGLSLFITGIALKNPILVLTSLPTAYLIAWLSHLFIEKNSPASFKYPIMSLIADLLMLVTPDKEIEKILKEN